MNKPNENLDNIWIHLWQTTGDAFWTFLTFFVGFGAVPIADLTIGEDSYNPTKEEETALRSNLWFRIHTIFYVWAYVASVCYLSKFCGNPADNGVELFSSAFWGISTSAGIASGFGIGCIHELIHRPTFTEMNHGGLVLLFCNYNHFWIEHLWDITRELPQKKIQHPLQSTKTSGPSFGSAYTCSSCRLVELKRNFRNVTVAHFGPSTIVSLCHISFLWSSILPSIIILVLSPLVSILCSPFSRHFLPTMQTILNIMVSVESVLATRRTNGVGILITSVQAGCMHGTLATVLRTGCSSRSSAILTTMLMLVVLIISFARTRNPQPTPLDMQTCLCLGGFHPFFEWSSATYNKIFPAGANNILSSAYKKTGEDFFVEGSSEYGGGVDKDADSSGSGAVWNGANKKRI